MAKLFIGGFPPETTELELVQLIAPYATVTTIQLIYDKVSKKSKGYGFVEVTSAEAAQDAALALNCSLIGDRELTVGVAPDAPKKQASAYRKVGPQNPVAATEKAKRPRRPRIG